MAAARSLSRRPSVVLGTGVGVLALFVIAMLFAATSTDGLPFATTTTARAAFTEIGDLREGDDVRIASARVGAVESIEPGDGQVVVTMRLDGERPLYRNADAEAATVTSRSALGQKFVNLTPGTPDAGDLGDDVITPSQTHGAEEIGDLFTIFDEPTRAAMRSSVQQTGGGLAGHQEDVHDLLATAPKALPALGTVSRTLSEDNGSRLASLLRSSDDLAGQFQGREQQISQLLVSSRTTLDAFGVDRTEPLRATLDTAPGSLHDVRAALDTLNGPLADTESAMADLRPGGQALGDATPDVRGVLREGIVPLDKVPGVAEDAKPALSELTHTTDDLRPLTPEVAKALASAGDTLTVLAPYAPEISQYFTNATSALSGHDASGHWLRIMPMVGTESVTGAGPALVEDPTTHRNPYPAPGQAENDRRPLPVSGERN